MVKPLTLEEALQMPEERREFIDGELYMPPSPSFEHQDIVTQLLMVVGSFVYTHKLGKVVVAPLDTVINQEICQPDLIFLSNERLGIIAEQGIQGAPDWLVEVVSPTSIKRDFETKKALYLGNGVREYWVISPEAKVIWVFQPDDLEGEVYGKGELEPAVLPGLKIHIPSLFS